MYRTTAVTFACVLTTATLACGDQSTEPETPATQLLVMAGNNQTRFPGTDLVKQLGVRLADDAGNPVRTSGIRVDWSISVGGGSISPLSDTTDISGLVFAEWTLGPGEGTNTVEVTAGNLAAATFDALAALAGPIAFSSGRGERFGLLDIFVMNADGSNVIQLTTAGDNSTVGDNWDPSWSPDGTQIVFAREYGLRSNHWELVVANADGSGETRLTNTPLYEGNLFPAWSPDGQRIAFASDGGVGGKADVYVMNADGSGRVNITNRAEIDQDPAWSPDGSRIAFMSLRDGNQEIYVMNADGTEQTRLTNYILRDHRPDWSPDGTKILFQREIDGACDGIWRINPDGTDAQEVVPCAHLPSWSADGTQFLASMLGVGDEIDVFAVDVQSGTWVNLTNHPDYDSWSAWRR